VHDHRRALLLVRRGQEQGQEDFQGPRLGSMLCSPTIAALTAANCCSTFVPNRQECFRKWTTMSKG
jgi:hypothetical protein